MNSSKDGISVEFVPQPKREYEINRPTSLPAYFTLESMQVERVVLREIYGGLGGPLPAPEDTCIDAVFIAPNSHGRVKIRLTMEDAESLKVGKSQVLILPDSSGYMDDAIQTLVRLSIESRDRMRKPSPEWDAMNDEVNKYDDILASLRLAKCSNELASQQIELHKQMARHGREITGSGVGVTSKRRGRGRVQD